MSSLIEFLSKAIHFFYSITQAVGIPNYGLAIILFTVAVKVALFPLTFQQVRSMRKMQELQPKLQQIQKKYKGNPQKAQQAMLELYRQEGVNPLSGCLPLLIQLPILFALFSALRTFFDPVHHPPYVNLEHANFLWVANLGQPDLYILPILVALGTFIQQKVSMASVSGAGDLTTQKTMLYIMPLIIGWMSRSFPAGLSLYWVVFSIMGIIEQWIGKRGSVLLKEGEMSAK
ncbi:MAG: YidC/Oxa1 family rane protein insertase [Clostridia bacterium]|nr:YidC/Oxa1 family rane protein insertase [Clostridia bacterium]